MNIDEPMFYKEIRVLDDMHVYHHIEKVDIPMAKFNRFNLKCTQTSSSIFKMLIQNLSK